DAARRWLTSATAVDTEDRVFRLLALHLVSASPQTLAAATDELLNTQRCDRGWAQTASMDSDAYATGAAMFALCQTGALTASDPVYRCGVRYLLERQGDDGSWHVASRSRPFQAYYETGFPHGRDQFISTSATAWAVLAMLFAFPQHSVPQE
ncbi:MAG: N-acyl-D-aspartate/D-glutamate deacylase, partial [Planctomycetaceae bacterium]